MAAADLNETHEVQKLKPSAERPDLKSTMNSLAIAAIVVVILIGLVKTCGRSDPEPEQPPPVTEAHLAASRRQATQYYLDFKSAAKPCDVATAAVDQATAQDDMVAAYTAADTARPLCSGASRAIGGLTTPSGLTEPQDIAFTDAREACSEAYQYKADAIGKLKKVINGDTRPSMLAELKDSKDMMELSQINCTAKIMSAVHDVGGITELN